MALFVFAETRHLYCAKASYQGFTSFLPLNELFDPNNGYLLKDTCIVEAEAFVFDKFGPEKVDSFTSVKVMYLFISAADCVHDPHPSVSVLEQPSIEIS